MLATFPSLPQAGELRSFCRSEDAAATPELARWPQELRMELKLDEVGRTLVLL